MFRDQQAMTRRGLLRSIAGVAGIAASHNLLAPFVPAQELELQVPGTDRVARPARACTPFEDSGRATRPMLGCLCRPWNRWSFDSALDEIRKVGFQLIGLVGSHEGETFISVRSTHEYLSRLKERIETCGLSAIVAWLPISFGAGFQKAVAQGRQQVDNAQGIGLKYLISGGVDRPDLYDPYYRVMADLAPYAQDRRIQIVVKPHGGCLAAAPEILHCLEKVNHPNFRVWYDAGNIIHYTGKDPVTDVQQLCQLVTGFCAKDCARPKGDVMIPFGTGKVDFKGVFSSLRRAGFKGPIMIECAGGRTLSEVTAGVRANREFLEQVFANS